MKRQLPADEAIETPNMTPFIDVTFQLLIFFMLTIRFKTVEGRLLTHLPIDLKTGNRLTSDASPKPGVEGADGPLLSPPGATLGGGAHVEVKFDPPLRRPDGVAGVWDHAPDRVGVCDILGDEPACPLGPFLCLPR